MIDNKPFILASSSPRRLALLQEIGLTPDKVIPAELDETRLKGELPREMALRLAKEKAAYVSAQVPDAYVLGSDTVVTCAARVLPKAGSIEDVARFLSVLSGRRHHVYTGVCLIAPDGRCLHRVSDSVVKFKRLSHEELADYAQSGEGIGKAGGYAIQGRAACLIHSMMGSYSGIVGLPLYELSQMIKSARRVP
ncbi:MAG: septum formation protein Maf [Proteobacteria bacterium]|nr:septum formation protein Maf [Pseudomonadota bacterium]